MSQPVAPIQSAARREPSISWWRRHWQKLVALLFWLALFGGYQWYAWRNDLTPIEVAQQSIDVMQSSVFGPLLFVAVYVLRPLVLFPATVLTLAAGIVFGPLFGILYTIIGSNLSALLAFWIGRLLGDGLFDGTQTQALVQRYTERLRRNSFETVLTMRFLLLPYDLVNYLCGVVRIDWKAYMLATVIGSLPGTIAIVLAGSSITGDLSDGLPRFDPRIFVVSVVLFLLSLAIARYVKRREQHAPHEQ